MPRKNKVDPFDIVWNETDPLGREALMLKSIINLRESLGKHPDPPEFLDVSEVRTVISDPDRIDISSSNPDRNIYYRENSNTEYTHSRAVVDYGGDENRGIVISWSNYQRPVSSSGVLYNKEERR